MSLVRSLGYIGIRTAHLEEWCEFASEALAMAVGAARADGTVPVRMDERALRLLLVPDDEDGIAYLGWDVADGAALAAAAEALSASGLVVTDGTADELDARRVRGMVWVTDPGGWRVEFSWGAAHVSDSPAFGHPTGGFVTDSLGVGHAVLHSPEAEAMIAFYRDVLGLRQRDQLGDVLAFLGCNERHHSIGIADVGGPARPLHLMVEVNDLEDLGTAFDRCLDRGVSVSTLGLHTNDRMLSFYVRTPSGFEVEYGWNGMLVDEDSWLASTIDRPSIWGHRQLDMEHPPRLRPFQTLTR